MSDYMQIPDHSTAPQVKQVLADTAVVGAIPLPVPHLGQAILHYVSVSNNSCGVLCYHLGVAFLTDVPGKAERARTSPQKVREWNKGLLANESNTSMPERHP